MNKINEAKTSDKSYDEMIVEKYGPIKTFSNYNEKYQEDRDFVSLRYSRKDFNDEKWKPKSSYDHPITTSKKISDEHRLP